MDKEKLEIKYDSIEDEDQRPSLRKLKVNQIDLDE